MWKQKNALSLKQRYINSITLEELIDNNSMKLQKLSEICNDYFQNYEEFIKYYESNWKCQDLCKKFIKRWYNDKWKNYKCKKDNEKKWTLIGGYKCKFCNKTGPVSIPPGQDYAIALTHGHESCKGSSVKQFILDNLYEDWLKKNKQN